MYGPHCMYYRTTVSQLSEAGGDLWVHLLQPLLKQGHTEQRESPQSPGPHPGGS